MLCLPSHRRAHGGDGREAVRTSVRMRVPCMPGDADLLQADAVAKPHDTRTLPCGMSCETCSRPRPSTVRKTRCAPDACRGTWFEPAAPYACTRFAMCRHACSQHGQPQGAWCVLAAAAAGAPHVPSVMHAPTLSRARAVRGGHAAGDRRARRPGARQRQRRRRRRRARRRAPPRRRRRGARRRRQRVGNPEPRREPARRGAAECEHRPRAAACMRPPASPAAVSRHNNCVETQKRCCVELWHFV